MRRHFHLAPRSESPDPAAGEHYPADPLSVIQPMQLGALRHAKFLLSDDELDRSGHGWALEEYDFTFCQS